MQLKIVTNNGTLRFNQTGQAITEITEPFVLVEVYVKEDGWTAVTMDGLRSAHFEHSVAVTDRGPYVLSQL